MPCECYLFEAKSIQNWILNSGKLRDLVGASELLDALCNAPLDDTLDALAIRKQIKFSRRAGAAFYAFSEQPGALDQLATLWPLVVQQYAPGLVFNQARGAGKDALTAFANTRQQLQANQAQNLVNLPQAGPRVHRSPRTGQAAVQMRKTPDGDLEAIDAATRRQRRFSSLKQGSLVAKLCPDSAALTATDWPLDLEPGDPLTLGIDPVPADNSRTFPFIGEQRGIAVLHADGNGLGQLLMQVKEHIAKAAPDRFIEAFTTLSKGIEDATIAAVREAVEHVLLPARADNSGPLPARPVLLGGDDLTLLLRADLALEFTSRFLHAFEQHSANAMRSLRDRFNMPDLPRYLTACAGIAYIKSSQPFHLAARLAEGITSAVKQRAKASSHGNDPAPSSLGFHRITTAMIDDYHSIIRNEMSTANGNTRYCHTLGAYALHAHTDLPGLQPLIALQALLAEPAMARGPARQVLGLMGRDHAQASARYRRWLTLMADPQRGQTATLKRYCQLMTQLTGSSGDALPYRKITDPAWQRTLGSADFASPLGDLHALSAMGNQPATQAPPQETTA